MFGIRILESYRVYGGRFYGLEEFSRGIFYTRSEPSADFNVIFSATREKSAVSVARCARNVTVQCVLGECPTYPG